MKKTFLIIISSILMQPEAGAQSKTGVENYNLLAGGEDYVWMPVVHHRGKKGWYTEWRYNYEAVSSVSVYAGKSFSNKGAIQFTVTPMLGLVFGNFKGGSMALNMELERKNLFASMQTQYTVNSNDAGESFFFNWTELGYQPLKWFYAGISTQLTRLYSGVTSTEYGIVAGLVIKNFSIPVYIFNPLGGKKNYIIGINAEW